MAAERRREGWQLEWQARGDKEAEEAAVRLLHFPAGDAVGAPGRVVLRGQLPLATARRLAAALGVIMPVTELPGGPGAGWPSGGRRRARSRAGR